MTDPRTEDDPPGSGRNKYTSYQVNVKTNMAALRNGQTEFAVRRRFNEFNALYKELNELAKAKFTKLPDLPPKTSLVAGRTRPPPAPGGRAAARGPALAAALTPRGPRGGGRRRGRRARGSHRCQTASRRS